MSNYQDKTKKTRASGEADLLRSEYLKTTDSRKRNFLMKQLIAIWMPYLLGKINDLPPDTIDEVVQIYRVRVLDSITKFKGKNGASFKSYLYWAAAGALDRHLAFYRKVRFEHQYQEIDNQTPQKISHVINSSVGDGSILLSRDIEPLINFDEYELTQLGINHYRD